MLTSKEYQDIAMKMLAARKIKFTDEIFSEICLALMTADKKFNPEIGNIEGFRKFYVDCYIKNYYRSNKKYYKMHSSLSDELALQIPVNESPNHDMLDFLEKSKLSTVEKQIIKKRFWEKKTLLEIGSEEQLSKEGVRLIIEKAAKKLKNELKEQNI